MYADLHQTFARPDWGVENPTRARPMGQLDLHLQVPILDAQRGVTERETDGMGIYKQSRLWIYCGAVEDVPTGFTLTLQHADEEGGTYENLVTFGPTTQVTNPGETVFKNPVPMAVKNWVRFLLSSPVQTNIIYTPDVEKLVLGLRGSGV